MSKSKSRWVLPLEETLKLKHFILFFGQFGHLLSDSLHECRGGEAAEGNAVNVLHHLRQVLLGWCARGEGGLLQWLLIFQRQPGGAALWVAGVRKSLYVTWQGQLENKKEQKSTFTIRRTRWMSVFCPSIFHRRHNKLYISKRIWELRNDRQWAISGLRATSWQPDWISLISWCFYSIETWILQTLNVA